MPDEKLDDKLERLREFLSRREEWFYPIGARIGREEVALIRSMPVGRRKYLFPSFVEDKGCAPKYSVETKCPSCGKYFWLENRITKTGMMRLFELESYFIDRYCVCDDCVMRRKIEKAKKKESEEKQREEFCKHAMEEVEKFIDPDYDFSNVDAGMKFGLVETAFKAAGYRRSEAFSKLRDMPYDDFLRTPYWDAISTEVKRKKGWRCGLCGGSGVLNVHHRDYKNHGYELYHLDDLICLCSACHSKFHGKEL